MTTYSRFLLLVQTGLLARVEELGWKKIMVWLEAATQVPEESIPNDVFLAASSWVGWQSRETTPAPDWLKAYRATQQSRVQIERLEGASEWWENAGELVNVYSPPAHRDLLMGVDTIVLPPDEAKDLLEWARSIPGWSDAEPPFKLQAKT